MKQFKTYISIILIFGISVSICFGQKNTIKKQLQFDVSKNTTIELNSSYTNIEFELTDGNSVIIDALMNIEGLTKKDSDKYFKNWNIKAYKEHNKLIINSTLNNKNTTNLNKNGYYNGYFIDKNQLNLIKSEIKNYSQNTKLVKKTSNSTQLNKSVFDYDAYIKEGNNYLIKWQKENNETIGKRWFNKTKKERIALQKARKPNTERLAVKKQQTTVNPKQNLKVKIKKNTQLKVNVRALSNRAIINKTLRIKIPKQALLSIKVRHGKVTFSNEIKNLKADLSYVLLNAKNITGSKTYIKSAYSNFEIEKWQSGKLEAAFSDFVLIKEVKNMDVVSNFSTVSIDKVTNYLNAKGSFKMLSVDFSNSFKHAIVNVVDSKKVWLKIPKNEFNLSYSGKDSKLLYPEKYELKSIKDNEKLIQYFPNKNNKKTIEIKSLSSIMQIYDIDWNNLKVKSLENL